MLTLRQVARRLVLTDKQAAIRLEDIGILADTHGEYTERQLAQAIQRGPAPAAAPKAERPTPWRGPGFKLEGLVTAAEVARRTGNNPRDIGGKLRRAGILAVQGGHGVKGLGRLNLYRAERVETWLASIA